MTEGRKMGVEVVPLDHRMSHYGACFLDNTYMMTFGPVFPSVEEAQEFMEWLPESPREYFSAQLRNEYHRFLEDS